MKRYYYFLTCKSKLEKNQKQSYDYTFNCELSTNDAIDTIEKWRTALKEVFKEISNTIPNYTVKDSVLLFYYLMKTEEVDTESPISVDFM